MMTEDEAKEKWCPHARVVHVSPDLDDMSKAHNRLILTDDAETTEKAAKAPEYMCIGSACMAWRWNRKVAGPRQGFCGLAGKP